MKRSITVFLKGGLGNQLFQYATMRSFMIDYGMDGILNTAILMNIDPSYYQLNHFKLSNCVKEKKSLTLMERAIVHAGKQREPNNIELVLQNFGIYYQYVKYIPLRAPTTKNAFLCGFFQCDKFFDQHRSVLIDELQIQDEFGNDNNMILEEIMSCNSVCVHVRRGDYVGTRLETCTPLYYNSAINKIGKMQNNPTFFVFSDDISWARNNIDFRNYTTRFIEGNSATEDMKLMYHCHHFIISNSSFSWWAQYLSRNDEKTVIAPSQWYSDRTESDIFQTNWTRIEC